MWLSALEEEQMERIRGERNALPDGILRTPYVLTREMQNDWYHREIANRNSRTRYWALMEPVDMVGYGGLENIEWENGIAEMSLMIFAPYRGVGRGRKAVDLFLDAAFLNMRLEAVYAEVYSCNPNAHFWEDRAKEHKALTTVLPCRKFYNGNLLSSVVYTFRRPK